MKNILFWNVDTQVDFMLPIGKLYVEFAQGILPALKHITDVAKLSNIPVVNTMDDHLNNSEELSDTPDFINKFPKHCMRNSFGQIFVDETNPFLIEKEQGSIMVFPWDVPFGNYLDGNIKECRNFVITKDKFDVFEGNPNTEKILSLITKTFDIKTVYVYGVAENVCCDFAVMGLLERKYNVVIISDAMKSLSNIPDVREKWINNSKKFDTNLKFTTSIDLINELI